MKTFIEFIENYGGSVYDPSGVEDHGDGGDEVIKKLPKQGAFPTYGNDLPITKKNKINYMKKCNCKK
jgi:hypothetical protein